MFGNIKKCKIEGCNNPIWGSGLCINHKPRKPLPKNKLNTFNKKPQNVESIQQMKDFFLELWKKRSHYSEVSGKLLGNEPLTVFFHHILPKNKYPEAAFDEENIILLTLEEHDQVEMDIYRYNMINDKRKILLEKYGK